MEIEGHPTQDLVEELVRRGALRAAGSSSGPDINALRFIAERLEDAPGSWMFLPDEAVFRGFEDAVE
ncbi:MAG: hypothetical protein ABR575_01730 [Actinomycetota bacterium]